MLPSLLEEILKEIEIFEITEAEFEIGKKAQIEDYLNTLIKPKAHFQFLNSDWIANNQQFWKWIKRDLPLIFVLSSFWTDTNHCEIAFENLENSLFMISKTLAGKNLWPPYQEL